MGQPADECCCGADWSRATVPMRCHCEGAGVCTPDEFGRRAADIRRPTRLCNPARRNDGIVRNRQSHLGGIGLLQCLEPRAGTPLEVKR
jgi:hypothetical protein